MPTVNIDGLKVEYEEQGAGLPVVFVPGLTGSKDWFRYQMSGLSERYRIISYNLPAASRKEAYTIDMLTEHLARFVNARRLINAVIVGHSFGGLVAQNFALTYPQQTSALVLSSTFPVLQGYPEHSMTEMLSPAPIEFESRFAALWRRLRGRQGARTEESEGLGWLAGRNAGINRQTLHARLGVIERFDSTDRLGNIVSPTLLVVGADDHQAILSGTQRLDEGIPDTNLEVIEGGDHFMFYTRHDLYNDVLDEFLLSHLSSLS